MVDLVKIRKKAKQKAEGRKQKEDVPVAEIAPAPQPRIEDQKPRTEDRGPRTSKLQRFLETAGQRKTIEAAKTVTAPNQLELLTFYIAGELYAIDIENVVEIITPRPVTRVPNADPSVVGIFSLRGTVVTLLDVRRRLGHGSEETITEDVRVVVLQHETEHVGFTVDRVLRVVKADAASLEPQPVVHASEQDESVRGVFRLGEALTILLDFEKLLSRT